MNMNAMVVDDSGIMRKLVMKSLREAELAQFTFFEACDGQDALNKFDPDAIDIMFVDWNMPNMSGIDLVKAIKANPKSHARIVMITTESTMGKVEEALNQGGADCFVVKPFTTDVLKKKLEPLFEQIAQQSAKGSGFFSKLATKLA